MILAYASLLDLKYREIDDRSWISLVVLGFVFLAGDLLSKGFEIIVPFIFSVGVTLIIVVVLYRLGIMGGGDCKILFGISILLFQPIHFSIFPIFSLGVFTNAIILSLVIPFFFFIYNIKRLVDVRSLKEFLVLFLGYKKKGSDIKSYETAIEDENGIKLFLDTKTIELGEKLSTDDEVWVSPAIPFVVLITVGFLISVFFGDFISYIALFLSELR